MKALLIALGILLVLGHPAAAAAVIAAELGACGVLGALIWRAARFRPCPHRRTAW
jgi:hypothetical protein